MPQIVDWIYENKERAYPLKEGINRSSPDFGYMLTNNIILDASLKGEDIQLVSIVKTTNAVTINLSNSDSFSCNTPITAPEYVRLPNGNLLVIGTDVNDLLTGTHTFTHVFFEPTTYVNYNDEWLGVSSIQFNDEVLDGTIEFEEGHQFGITSNDNVVRLSVSSLQGIPLQCSIATGESDCHTLVSYLNGVGPIDGSIRLNSGTKMVVIDDPTNHRLFIGFNFLEEDICQVIPPKKS